MRGSDAVVWSSSLLFGSHRGRGQAEPPLIPCPDFQGQLSKATASPREHDEVELLDIAVSTALASALVVEIRW